MKRSLIILLLTTCCLYTIAQTTTETTPTISDQMAELQVRTQESIRRTQETLREWDTEHMMDTLDQEKLPKLVSGGLLAGGNLSNFIITNDKGTMSSYMRVGADLGAFIDFAVTKHFGIQMQLRFTAEQNRFASETEHNHLWSFGTNIPLFFMGRFGSLEKGYLNFGGGPFTHFTFASNIQSKYSSNTVGEVIDIQKDAEKHVMEKDYNDLYKLHQHHSGIAGTIGYEFNFGMQINAIYQISLTDIFTYYSQNKGSKLANAAIYPQCVSLVLGYRWK